MTAVPILRGTLLAVRALLALALAGTVLLVAGLPSHALDAVDAVALTAPGPNERLTGPTTIVVAVDASRLQQVDEVHVRISRLGTRVGVVRALDLTSGVRTGGRGQWTASLDPLASWAAGDGPMANDEYRFETEVRWTGPAGQQATPWSGHDAVIDAAPPSTSVLARVVDAGARSVEVTWDPISLPDFRRYLLQRATGGDGFDDVATLTASTTTRFVDAPPEPATYRYRVVVVRGGADGGDRTSTSDERSVVIAPPAPPAPTPGEEPVPPTDGTGAGVPGVPGATAGDPGPAAGGPSSSGLPATGGFSLPRLQTGSETPLPTPVPAAPPQLSPGDDVFEAELPFPDAPQRPLVDDREVVLDLPERDDAVDEVVRRGPEEGGTLSIYDRELHLEEVLPPVAGGLLMFVMAGHLLRLQRTNR